MIVRLNNPVLKLSRSEVVINVDPVLSGIKARPNKSGFVSRELRGGGDVNVDSLWLWGDGQIMLWGDGQEIAL